MVGKIAGVRPCPSGCLPCRPMAHCTEDIRLKRFFYSACAVFVKMRTALPGRMSGQGHGRGKSVRLRAFCPPFVLAKDGLLENTASLSILFYEALR